MTTKQSYGRDHPRVRGEKVVSWYSAGHRELDHPRVRGEKCLRGHHPAGRPGSPPRARGEDALALHYYTKQRITPACAGRSLADLRSHGLKKDHPRVRGEK